MDEAQTIEVSTLYLSKRLYKFQRINQANTHPFFISDSGYKTESTKITFSGDGNFDTGIANNESFIVDLSNLTVDDTLYYYCTAHDRMVSTFSIDIYSCLLYTSPSPRDRQKSRMPSSA